MTKKVCKNCRLIYEGTKCPECGSIENAENAKGKIYVFKPEESEIAKGSGIKKPGIYAIKT